MNETRVMSRRDIWVHMLLYPGHTLPTAAAPAMVAVGLAVRNEVFAAVPVLLAFLAGWLIQLGGVLTDSYENLVKHPNDREHPHLVHALRDGALTLSGLRTAILACYGVALLAGAWLLHHAGLPVLVIGLLSIGASWVYSAGPFPFGERGIADPLFFVFFGIVSVAGCYYVQAVPTYGHPAFWRALADAFPFSAFALSLPIGALTTNILVIDDIRDREFDVVKGKRTIAVRAGIAWSRTEFAVLAALSYLAPFWCWLGLGLGTSILLPLLTLPYALSTVRGALTLDSFEDLVPMTPKAARLLLAYAVLLAIGAAYG
jgi:1,4-dihydroxy-2-naphthoate octaprenyltransferase